MKSLILLYVTFILIHLGCTAPNESSANNQPLITNNSITRSEIILLADTFARVRWTMSQDNVNAGGCASNNNFISQYPVGQRMGMGYKWNGWEDVDDFLDKIASGYGTGTGGYVNYENMGIPNECFTGVSCTGLVSKVWKLETKHTLNYGDAVTTPQFRDRSSEITYEQLQKGDALINSEHIMLYAYTNRDGVIMIFDSSGEGVSFRPVAWSYLNPRNTMPIRYNLVRDDEIVQGTSSNPILINSSDLPFTHDGNTRNVVSMEYDHYSIIPARNEQGPECIYQLNITSSVSIDVSINDLSNEGIDNSIFILTSLSAENFETSNCIAWGDTEINIELNAGTYFIIVDSGNDTPGEYSLSIN